MGEDALYGKALSNALSFDTWESGSSKLVVKNKATGDAHWMCNTIMVYTYRVGFGVARSYDQGDARASMCGTSNRSDSHAFLYISQTIY